MYLNFGYCGFKELNFLNYLLKLIYYLLKERSM